MSGSEPNPREDAREPEDELELDLDLDLDPTPGEAPEQASAAGAPHPAPGPASGGSDLDLDLDLPGTAPAAEPEPVSAAEPAGPSALDVDLDDLDLSDDAPEGLYERPDEALAMGAPEAPVTIGDEDLDGGFGSAGYEGQEGEPHGEFEDEELDHADDDGFDAGDLGIDFETPAPTRSNRGIVVAAGIAGALAAGVLAVVDPGRPEPEPLPGAAAPTTALRPLEPAPTPAPATTEPAATSEPAAPEVASVPVDRVAEGFDLLTPMTEALGERAALFAGLAPAAGGEAVAADPDGGVSPGSAPARAVGGLARMLGGLLGGAADRAGEPAEVAVAEAPAATEGTGDPMRESRTARLDVMDQVLLPEDRTGIEFVEPGELEDVWLGEEIPPDGVAGRRNRLTPRVGPVRLITNLGEVFQGELYAIGGGEVSLSNHLGRMSFAARQVERLERLPSADEALPVATDAPGRRVRVRVPGGWIQGRVLAEDRGRVTLLTESGGRVTLPATEVLPLGAADVLPYPSSDQTGAADKIGVAPAEKG